MIDDGPPPEHCTSADISAPVFGTRPSSGDGWIMSGLLTKRRTLRRISLTPAELRIVEALVERQDGKTRPALHQRAAATLCVVAQCHARDQKPTKRRPIRSSICCTPVATFRSRISVPSRLTSKQRREVNCTGAATHGSRPFGRSMPTIIGIGALTKARKPKGV